MITSQIQFNKDSICGADVPQEIREKNGITDCTLRLSVGIEDARDLIAELTQVFAELS